MLKTTIPSDEKEDGGTAKVTRVANECLVEDEGLSSTRGPREGARTTVVDFRIVYRPYGVSPLSPLRPPDRGVVWDGMGGGRGGRDGD